MKIDEYDLDVAREPLTKPFGFKGGAFHEKWICDVTLKNSAGSAVVGQGGLAVLWSDAAVFAKHSETGGNVLMTAILERACQMVVGRDFEDPMVMLDSILDDLYEFAVKITGEKNLRKTFALNPLVALDNAAWTLRAVENGTSDFLDLIPCGFRAPLEHENAKLAAIPLLTYKVSPKEMLELLEEGYFVLKVKIGQAGDEKTMLEADMRRLTEVHETIGNREVRESPTGKPLYYLDANGRYETKDAVNRLMDHLDEIGALDQVVILEEPFDENLDIAVDDLPVRVAADESCHDAEEAAKRLDMGYGAIALKPAGKTLSMSLKTAKIAYERGVPCYVADSACPPALVEWNKNVAARLAPLPEAGHALLESNGPHFYKNWNRMVEEQPFPDAPWRLNSGGLFKLDDHFYEVSGGIFHEKNIKPKK